MYPPIFIVIACLALLSLGPAHAEVDTARWTSEPWMADPSAGRSTANDKLQEGPLISDLAFLNISENEPSALRLGGRDLPYGDYIRQSRSCELWVLAGESWSRYASAEALEPIDVVAYAPVEGMADIYLIDYSRNATHHRRYDLLPGYYQGSIALNDPGRIFVIISQNDQPGNALVIDVMPEVRTGPGVADLNNFYLGEAMLTITSDWLKGYDVYVDGTYRCSDQKDGQLDGTARIEVSGDRTHTLTISKIGGLDTGPYKSEYIKKFESRTAYTLKI